MGKEATSNEELQAVKELIEKIPPEDLERAVGGMDEETREKLKEFLHYIGISAAAIGTGALICKYWPKVGSGASSESPLGSSPGLSESAEPARRTYRYRTDEGIKRAYRDGRLKNMTQLKDAYMSLHPDFHGKKQDVLAILGL